MQMWNAGVSVSALSVSWLKVCFIVGECDGGEAAEAVLCNGLPLYKYQNMNLHCHSDADARPCADTSSCLLQTVFLCEIHSVWFAWKESEQMYVAARRLEVIQGYRFFKKGQVHAHKSGRESFFFFQES